MLDTGGVDALVPVDPQSRARLRVLRRRAVDLEVPAAVLAEGLLTGHPGRDHHVARFLHTLSVVGVGENLGFAAGSLRTQAIRAGADPPPSGVDACVAALADWRAANDDVEIVTSDEGDLVSLALFGDHPDRVSTIRV